MSNFLFPMEIFHCQFAAYGVNGGGGPVYGGNEVGVCPVFPTRSTGLVIELKQG